MWEKVFLDVCRHTPCNNGTTGVKQDKNNHNLSITHTVGLVMMSGLLILNHIFLLL